MKDQVMTIKTHTESSESELSSGTFDHVKFEFDVFFRYTSPGIPPWIDDFCFFLQVFGQTYRPGEPLGGLGDLPEAAPMLLEPIFQGKFQKQFLHGLGARNWRVDGQEWSGATQSGAQPAVRTLGSRRLRPG